MIVRSCSAFAAAVVMSLLGAAVPASAADDNRLTVKNACTTKIWIQQLNVDNAPVVVALKPGASHTYKIAAKGDESTRFWPKSGCDSSGYNCAVGESQGKPKGGAYTCPKAGCSPPVDSKVEVNWACVGSGCNVKQAKTFYDVSQVDGFTLPFNIKASGSVNNPACENTKCAALDMKKGCPTAENLSTNGQFPTLAKVDLRMRHPKTNAVVGCFSPCEKLTASNFGGLGYAPSAAEAQYYCCPTPPISSAQCNAGPVPKTGFVKTVHKACGDKAYAFSYDDADGNHACQGYTNITMTICP